MSTALHSAPPQILDFPPTARPPLEERSDAEAEAHPDADLIRACVRFGIAVRGSSGGFEADPTGDCIFASAKSEALLKRAEKEWRFASNYLPSTMDGLRAKAAIVEMAIDIDQPSLKAFLRSFADDVVRFHRASANTNAEIAP